MMVGAVIREPVLNPALGLGASRQIRFPFLVDSGLTVLGIERNSLFVSILILCKYVLLSTLIIIGAADLLI